MSKFFSYFFKKKTTNIIENIKEIEFQKKLGQGEHGIIFIDNNEKYIKKIPKEPFYSYKINYQSFIYKNLDNSIKKYFPKYYNMSDENNLYLEYLKDYKPITEENLMNFSRNKKIELLNIILKELKILHDNGFYHRDLHENNILFKEEDSSFKVKFIDLGLSILKKNIDKDDELYNRLMTRHKIYCMNKYNNVLNYLTFHSSISNTMKNELITSLKQYDKLSIFYYFLDLLDKDFHYNELEKITDSNYTDLMKETKLNSYINNFIISNKYKNPYSREISYNSKIFY